MNGTSYKLVVATDNGWFDMFNHNQVDKAKSTLAACKVLDPSARLEWWSYERVPVGQFGDWIHGKPSKSAFKD